MASLDILSVKYPAKQHARQVGKALAIKKGLIVLSGQQTKFYTDSDMGCYFRQLRYFFYLSGVLDADCFVTYDIADDDLVLWCPKQRTQREILYMGPVITPEVAREKYEVDGARYARDLPDFVIDFMEDKKGKVYVLHPESTDGCIPEARMSQGDLPLDAVSLLKAMNACRVIKDDWEIAAIRQANRITAKAHVEVLKHVSQIHSERSVEGIYIGTCLAGGAKSQAYAPIAGSGSNAATLHYGANNEDFGDRQLVLLDAGAEFGCYACDVTRTFPTKTTKKGDWLTKEARQIYEVVEEMQEACIERVKPGVLFRDLNVLAHYVLVKGLLQLGILHNGSQKEILAAGTSLAFMPHGLGHHVGLEVHDVEDAERPMLATQEHKSFGLTVPTNDPNFRPFWIDDDEGADISPHEFETHYGHLIPNDGPGAVLTRATQGLRTGMVVTIEPGIYFNPFAFEEIYFKSPVHSKFINKDVLKKYMDVGGVRIEDDILVTKRGYENLTVTPKGDEALKIISEGQTSKWHLDGQGSIKSRKPCLQALIKPAKMDFGRAGSVKALEQRLSSLLDDASLSTKPAADQQTESERLRKLEEDERRARSESLFHIVANAELAAVQQAAPIMSNLMQTISPTRDIPDHFSMFRDTYDAIEQAERQGKDKKMVEEALKEYSAMLLQTQNTVRAEVERRMRELDAE